ncbi:MAG: peptidase [Candidatus Taylorbacteria bacterium]|nr:peptidase [Candidatus Taylorbacteria bacterium]
MEPISLIFSIIILIMSVVIHEFSHGYVAELLGDPTPRLDGRLTLNPLKHLELFGSVIVPIITSLGGFTFGWAKPVVWNPYNVKNRRLGEFLISAAGPASNLLIAVIFGFTIRYSTLFSGSFVNLAAYVVLVNIVLAVFNLIPIPPLDGSKILFSLFPPTPRFERIRFSIERYSLFLMVIIVLFLWRLIAPIVPLLFTIITGAK